MPVLMNERYIPHNVEKKWQERWEEDGLYRKGKNDDRPNYYFLTMLPYTSGDLHVGHWFAMAPSDAAARYRRMRGDNVFFPIGFDAFGLPAENAAIKGGLHPHQWTYDNIERMRGQLKRMGTMFDWSSEIITSDPGYYRWTQWWFLKFYEKGLAYRDLAPANWCPSCQTVLANEQVVADGNCERCETPVTHRDIKQWLFRTTDYAEQLLDESGIDWPERVLAMQRNWIGRSEGVEITFELDGAQAGGERLSAFTTRPDTIFGVTFIALAPEHLLVDGLTTADRRPEANEYVAQARHQTDIERLSTTREKTGVFTGRWCRNPVSGEMVPIWIADYVLPWYGTGVVMGVPAHDERDFQFAQRYRIPIRVVVAPSDWDSSPLMEAHTGPGVMINSGQFDGMTSEEGKRAIAKHIETGGWGESQVTYRLRDWLISRQRYWGCPIPIVYCDECDVVPVPEGDLPVLLPKDADFQPTGESPLARHLNFAHVRCPRCSRPARRETDTMDTFMDSNWYFMRYLSPDYKNGPVDAAEVKKWLPVDQYTGGAEHAVMHLLYSRFFWKVARDLGVVAGDEPFRRLFNQGQILGPDGQRMSKSRGNVVTPDEQIEKYGADAFRCYLMFLGPWEDGGPFNPQGIIGIWRWLNRVWGLFSFEEELGNPDGDSARSLRRVTHATIRRVTQAIEAFRFNTALASLMEFTNYLQETRRSGPVSEEAWEEASAALLLMLAPLAPHIAEELWVGSGRGYSVHRQPWPIYDIDLATAEEAILVVQVNGKVRDKLNVAANINEEEAREQALASPRVKAHLGKGKLQKIVYVPGKLVNLVVR